YITGRKGPHAGRDRSDSPLVWAAKGYFFEQEHQKRVGKLFATFDISDMKLIDLPIWPVDQEGNILTDLVEWMVYRGRAPPRGYYLAKKVSLRELLPENELPQPKLIQPSLFSEEDLSASGNKDLSRVKVDKIISKALRQEPDHKVLDETSEEAHLIKMFFGVGKSPEKDRRALRYKRIAKPLKGISLEIHILENIPHRGYWQFKNKGKTLKIFVKASEDTKKVAVHEIVAAVTAKVPVFNYYNKRNKRRPTSHSTNLEIEEDFKYWLEFLGYKMVGLEEVQTHHNFSEKALDEIVGIKSGNIDFTGNLEGQEGFKEEVTSSVAGGASSPALTNNGKTENKNKDISLEVKSIKRLSKDYPLIVPRKNVVYKGIHWEENGAFNMAAFTLDGDKRTIYGIYRAEGEDKISRLGLAIIKLNKNGQIEKVTKFSYPIISPNKSGFDQRGCEDPRTEVIEVEENGKKVKKIAVSYSAVKSFSVWQFIRECDFHFKESSWLTYIGKIVRESRKLIIELSDYFIKQTNNKLFAYPAVALMDVDKFKQCLDLWIPGQNDNIWQWQKYAVKGAIFENEYNKDVVIFQDAKSHLWALDRSNSLNQGKPKHKIRYRRILDLKNKKWEKLKQFITPRGKNYYREDWVGAGTNAVELHSGLLMFYHSAIEDAEETGREGHRSYFGHLVLLDKEDPRKILWRSQKPVISPKTWWEKGGLGGKLDHVFPEGLVLLENKHDDGREYAKLLMFYGARDEFVGAVSVEIEIKSQTDEVISNNLEIQQNLDLLKEYIEAGNLEKTKRLISEFSQNEFGEIILLRHYSQDKEDKRSKQQKFLASFIEAVEKKISSMEPSDFSLAFVVRWILEEFSQNIIKHASDNLEGKIQEEIFGVAAIYFSSTPEGLRLNFFFQDNGGGSNLESLLERINNSTTEGLENENGRGIYMSNHYVFGKYRNGEIYIESQGKRLTCQGVDEENDRVVADLSNIDGVGKGFLVQIQFLSPKVEDDVELTKTPNASFGEGILTRHHQVDSVIDIFPKELVKRGSYFKTRKDEKLKKQNGNKNIKENTESKLRVKIDKAIELVGEIYPERKAHFEKDTSVVLVDFPGYFLLYGDDRKGDNYFQLTHIGRERATIYMPKKFLEEIKDRKLLATLLNHDQQEVETYLHILADKKEITVGMERMIHKKAMKDDPFGMYSDLKDFINQLVLNKPSQEIFTEHLAKKTIIVVDQQIKEKKKEIKKLKYLRKIFGLRFSYADLAYLYIKKGSLLAMAKKQREALKYYKLSLYNFEYAESIDAGGIFPIQLQTQILFFLAAEGMTEDLIREFNQLLNLSFKQNIDREDEKITYKNFLQKKFPYIKKLLIQVLKHYYINEYDSRKRRELKEAISVIQEKEFISQDSTEKKEIIVKQKEINTKDLDALVEKDHCLDITGPISRDKALTIISKFASKKTDINSKKLLNKFIERENKGSTIIRKGLAIPHIVITSYQKYEIFLVRCKEGVDFPQEQSPVKVMFVLLGPRRNKEEQSFHLKILSKISELASQPDFMEKVDAVMSKKGGRHLLSEKGGFADGKSANNSTLTISICRQAASMFKKEGNGVAAEMFEELARDIENAFITWQKRARGTNAPPSWNENTPIATSKHNHPAFEYLSVKAKEIINQHEQLHRDNFKIDDEMLICRMQVENEKLLPSSLKKGLEAQGFKKINFLKEVNRYFYDYSESRSIFFLRMEQEGNLGLYVAKSRRCWANEPEDDASQVLEILHISNPQTFVVDDFFVSRFVGSVDLKEISLEKLNIFKFRKSLAFELGKAMAAAYIIGVADRSVSNIRLVFNFNKKTCLKAINIDLTTAFMLFNSNSGVEEQSLILKWLVTKGIYAGLSVKQTEEMKEYFIKGFYFQYRTTCDFYIENKTKVDKILKKLSVYPNLSQRLSLSESDILLLCKNLDLFFREEFLAYLQKLKSRHSSNLTYVPDSFSSVFALCPHWKLLHKLFKFLRLEEFFLTKIVAPVEEAIFARAPPEKFVNAHRKVYDTCTKQWRKPTQSDLDSLRTLRKGANAALNQTYSRFSHRVGVIKKVIAWLAGWKAATKVHAEHNCKVYREGGVLAMSDQANKVDRSPYKQT
ncbi:MAG: PTS sugar transporter subunit IIA, partial [Candidatus Omnitrophica bacterium]|nr:PTS sugar transporter subunit IIA [Candidatus Omnitrophota bacterium]